MGDKRLTGWTDERVARLKELWSAGWSASQIAADLGFVTRNAVCGKIDRLGLSGIKRSQKVMAARAPVIRRTGDHLARVQRIVQARSAVDAVIRPEPFVVQDIPHVSPRHIGLMELSDSTCKWPFGDGPFTFCGCEVRGSGPYCVPHARIAGAGYGDGGRALFGSEAHRRKLSEAQKARHAARRSAA